MSGGRQPREAAVNGRLHLPLLPPFLPTAPVPRSAHSVRFFDWSHCALPVKDQCVTHHRGPKHKTESQRNGIAVNNPPPPRSSEARGTAQGKNFLEAVTLRLDAAHCSSTSSEGHYLRPSRKNAAFSFYFWHDTGAVDGKKTEYCETIYLFCSY